MRRAVRVGPAVVIVATVLLAGGSLAGCQGASAGPTAGTGGMGTPGTSSNGGVGGDGGNGYGGWGGNGYGGNGGDASAGAEGASGDGFSDRAAVAGSGRLISRTVDLAGVTSVVADSAFVVRLQTGETPQAVVRTDDNLADLVDSTVTGNQLHLGIKPGRSVRDATLGAEVTVSRLEKLSSSGASRIILASTVASPALQLVVSGAGAVTGPVRIGRVDATVSGAGALALTGQVEDCALDASGGSRLPLAGLTVRRLDATLSGATQAIVTVSDTLAADATGASLLRYRGTPRVTRSQTSGASSVVPDSP